MSAVAVVRGGAGRLVLRVGPTWAVLHPRPVAVATAGLALTALLFVASLAMGTTDLTVAEVLAGLAGQGEQPTVFTIQRLRLPRALTALLVGLALGAAGALTQGLARNPLASPDVLGVTAGASAGAVAVLLSQGSATSAAGGAAARLSQVGLPLGAVAGAAAATVALLAVTAGRLDPLRLVIVGVVLAAACAGLVEYALVSGDVDQATRATVWLTGSLHGRGWEHVTGITVAATLLLPAALLLVRRLDLLLLGEDMARALGVPVGRTRLGVLLVAVALAGAATAAAGPVAFVALVAPNLARRLGGGPGVPLMGSAGLGAALVLGADLLARRLVPGHELPAGAVTALVGAPYLIWLILRTSRRTSS